MELPKIEDFEAVKENASDIKVGCDVCWFYQGSRCCNQREDLMKLLFDTEKLLKTDCGMNAVHYILKPTE